MTTPNRKEQWEYVGPGDGRGTHTVLDVDKSGEVVTWMASPGLTTGGWSWLGPMETFLQHFRRVPQPS